MFNHQNRKERATNRYTNNRDMAERAIRYVVRDGVVEWHTS